MRKLLLLSTFAALLATTGLAGAQNASVWHEHFCLMPYDTQFGLTSCRFHTWDQCIAIARRSGRLCTTNPWWHGPQQPTTQDKSRPRNG